MKKNNKSAKKNHVPKAGEDEFFLGMLVMGMIFLILFVGIFGALTF